MLRVPSSALSSVMEAITPEFMGTHCITEMIVGGHVLTVEKVMHVLDSMGRQSKRLMLPS